MRIRPFEEADERAVIELWALCGLVMPHNDAKKDIARKLRVDPELFLVGEVEGNLVGTCMAGYEGHRGWLNYLAVNPTYQRRGYATELLRAAEKLLEEKGCPKINLQVRTSNTAVIQFYARQGFAVDEVVSMGKRLVVDDPTES